MTWTTQAVGLAWTELPQQMLNRTETTEWTLWVAGVETTEIKVELSYENKAGGAPF